MRLLPILILSLLASSAGAQLLPIIIDGGGGGDPAAPDWTAPFVTTYEADNSATSSGGSCGTDCDLTANNGATFTATDPWSGSHSFDLAGTSNESFSCANATCNEITGLTGSVTLVCAARPTTAVTTPAIMDWGDAVAFTGARITATNSVGTNFSIGDGTDFVTKTGDTALTINVWNHVGAVHDATADTLRLYLNGQNNSAAAGTQQDMVASSQNFVIGDQGPHEWIGQIDECGIYSGVIGPESMCRICSCGIDGAQCTVSGTSFTDTGRNVASCGSCTLPTDASQATPGTN